MKEMMVEQIDAIGINMINTVCILIGISFNVIRVVYIIIVSPKIIV